MVDDHKMVVQSYIELLKDVKNFNIIGCAFNGQEALKSINNTTPDVVILDCEMPVMNGFKTLQAIREKHPFIKVIILTMHFEPGYSSQYLINGAHSFLSKHCDSEELIKAIHKVIDEGYYFSSTISRNFITNTLDHVNFKETYRKLRLTDREIEILKLICEGKQNTFIAEKLNISINTIKSFRKLIYQKTNTDSIIELIKYAIRNGITPIHNSSNLI